MLASFPDRAVIDGEIILVDPDTQTLDFETLQLRLHPASSRVTELALETPASFVAFDLIALDDDDLTGRPFSQRRTELERALAGAAPPVHVTPITDAVDVAQVWFRQLEGAGLDGVIAKRPDQPYQQDKRVMAKIKHVRTVDCVVAGYRPHKSAPDAIGSLLLGLYQEDGRLASVGVVGALPMPTRRALFQELAPLVTTFDGHPWSWAGSDAVPAGRAAYASRWNAGKDLSFTPLRPVRVVEVRYDYMEGTRFRHTAQFVRWRPDREPDSCTVEQVERPPTVALSKVLGPL